MRPLKALRWRRESRSLPASHGNSLHLLCGGKEYFSSILAAISGARHEVLIESYIWMDDETGRSILGAAAAAARRGVVVRLIMDGVGSYGTGPSAEKLMNAAGGESAVYKPVWFMFQFRRWYERNHRKLAVIDGTTAFIGGFGFWNVWAEPPPAGWWDIGARVSGPIGGQFRKVFAHDWHLCRRSPLPLLREHVHERSGGEVMKLVPSVLGRRDLLRS